MQPLVSCLGSVHQDGLGLRVACNKSWTGLGSVVTVMVIVTVAGILATLVVSMFFSSIPK